jgi:hypothetical protein
MQKVELLQHRIKELILAQQAVAQADKSYKF